MRKLEDLFRKDRLVLTCTVMAILLFTVSSCGTKQPAPSKGTSETAAIKPSAPDTRDVWQQEWERLIKEGRREGKFVAHAGYSAEVLGAIRATFREKFGIEAEFVSGRGAELRARFFAERKAGLYTVDLLFRGASGMIADQKPAGELDPLEPMLLLPEVLEPKAWWGGKLNWIDEEHYILAYFAYPTGDLAINTSIVNPDEMKSWQDLLAPKWKNKITINDPTTTGSGNAWFHAMGKYILGMDYMRELVKQEPVLLRDLRLQAEWIATGKYPLAIAHGSAVIPEFVKAGAPITEKLLSEGGYMTTGFGAISQVRKAPHPNAARVFVNWILTREGQTFISRVTGSQSARVDVPTDHLSAGFRREGVKYMDARGEKYQLEQAQMTEVAREVFAPLLR